MATKGASNHYGNSRGGKQSKQAKNISYAWAKAFNKAKKEEHTKKHASNVKVQNNQTYAAKAIRFANTVDKKNVQSFIYAKSQATCKYNVVTNEFAIITKDGYVVTYFKPGDGYQYYKEQERK